MLVLILRCWFYSSACCWLYGGGAGSTAATVVLTKAGCRRKTETKGFTDGERERGGGGVEGGQGEGGRGAESVRSTGKGVTVTAVSFPELKSPLERGGGDREIVK